MLEVNNVCVSFRSERQEKIFGTARNQVLFDVSLKVSQGTCLGILGEADTADPGADWNCSEVLSAGLCVGYGGVHCLSCAAIENFYHFR